MKTHLCSCPEFQKKQVRNDGELLGMGLDFSLSGNKCFAEEVGLEQGFSQALLLCLYMVAGSWSQAVWFELRWDSLPLIMLKLLN